MQHLATTDYNGTQSWRDIRNIDDDDDSYPAPLITKTRSRGMSGSSTPGTGKLLTEKDLAKVDKALDANGH
jgi:hypothetical protein